MPESQRPQPFGDSNADFWVFDQTLARVQGILQESFSNPLTGMSGILIDSGIEFGLS